MKCQQIFGEETFEISVPSLPPGVVVNSPEVLEYVLKNEASITKGEFFRERSWDLFGISIALLRGLHSARDFMLTSLVRLRHHQCDRRAMEGSTKSRIEILQRHEP